GTVSRTVEVTIVGTNDAPDIQSADLTGSVTDPGARSAAASPVHLADTLLSDSGTIAFGDVDLSDAHVVSATPVGSTLGTLSVVKNHDTTGTGTDGLVTWTYDVAASAVAHLGAGQTQVESFTVTIDDGHGGIVTRQ